MALTLRIEENPQLEKTLDKVSKSLSCNTASGTIYKLIQAYEPTQKEIMQLRARIEALQAELQTYRDRFEVIESFSKILQLQRNGKTTPKSKAIQN